MSEKTKDKKKQPAKVAPVTTGAKPKVDRAARHKKEMEKKKKRAAARSAITSVNEAYPGRAQRRMEAAASCPEGVDFGVHWSKVNAAHHRRLEEEAAAAEEKAAE